MSIQTRTIRILWIGGVLLSALLLASRPGLAQPIYRWIDAGGSVHFTDDPGTIPPEQREASAEEQRRESSKLIEKTDASPAAAPPAKVTTLATTETAQAGGDETDPEDATKAISPYRAAVRKAEEQVDNVGRNKTFWQDRRHYWENRLAVSRRLHAEARREFYLVNQRFDSKEYKRMKALRQRLRRLEVNIAEAEEMLATGLAREARKAGAPPGWVR
jgi:hypothetical protein